MLPRTPQKVMSIRSPVVRAAIAASKARAYLVGAKKGIPCPVRREDEPLPRAEALSPGCPGEAHGPAAPALVVLGCAVRVDGAGRLAQGALRRRVLAGS